MTWVADPAMAARSHTTPQDHLRLYRIAVWYRCGRDGPSAFSDWYRVAGSWTRVAHAVNPVPQDIVF